MIVCCVYLQDTLGNPQNASAWLKVSEVYQVLSLERDSHGRLLVRLLLNQTPRAGLFPIEQFAIVSGKLPENWSANSNNRGLLTLESVMN
jgi:hypothetical protein